MTFEEEQELIALTELLNSDFSLGTLTQIADVISVGVGDNAESIVIKMREKGFVSNFSNSGRRDQFLVTPFGIKWYNALKRKKKSETRDNNLKRIVGITAILGTVGTILLTILSLMQQSEQRSLRQEVKQLTVERDSLRQVSDTIRRLQKEVPSKQQNTDTTN